MSIAKITPKIVSVGFLSILDRLNVWGSLTNENYTGELSSSGDKVSIPNFTKTITVSDYNEDGATVDERLAAAEEVTADSQDLTIDLKKATHFLVEDIEEKQTRPELLTTSIGRAAVAVSDAVDTYLNGVFDNSFSSAYTQIPGANASARTANIAARTTAIPVATTVGAADGAFGDAFIAALIVAKRKMSVSKIPQDGRWIVVHPDTIEGIERWALAKDADGVYVPATSEGTLRNGFSGSLLGFRMLTTTEVSSVQVAAANDAWQCVIGRAMKRLRWLSSW